MNQLLKTGRQIQTDNGMLCEVKAFLGGGGQGEVYRANLGSSTVALKWYFPEQATEAQKSALLTLIQKGAPNDKFLWPMSLITAKDIKGFGYVMQLRDNRFKSIVDLMKRRAEPSFRALGTAGFELAHSFLLLHTKGLCYRDISFGNVFFDPQSGEILICDNDNVTVDGQAAGGVLGTPRFMAPEVVCGKSLPCTQTDLYSLAVLLFYMFIVHHPLEGRKETEIKCFDQPAMNKLYGTDPVFIFDPNDVSNQPVQGYHDNAVLYWGIYPQFFKELFTKAFTDGIRDPQHGRVRESEWRSAMIRLRDSIIYCGHCGAENFYDMDRLKSAGDLNPCWACNKRLQAPPRIRIDKHVIMLNHDAKLFLHHVDDQKLYDFSAPIAEISRHPSNPNVWGLKNLSREKWTVTMPDASIKDVEPGRNLSIAQGVKIQFGKAEGEIRV